MTRQVDDLGSDYQAAGFGGALQPGAHPVLLLIDFARAYFDRESPLYAGVEAARASAARLRDAARAAGVPIIFTRVEYSADGHEGGVFYKKVGALKAFNAGNPLGEADGDAGVALRRLKNEGVAGSDRHA